MRKYKLNENYFEKIDTEEKAYWLGFICADGCISSCSKKTKSLRLKFNLHRKDKEVLEKFRISIEGDMPIKEFTSNKGIAKMESEEVKIDINSNKLCESLISKGVGFRKTYNLDMPEISKHLIRHFIRGYFDGDGCFCKYLIKGTDNYRYTFEIVGQSPEILEAFQKYFESVGIKTTIYTRQSNKSKRLMTGSKKELIKLSKLLYEDSNIFIHRKSIVSQELLQLAV